MSLIFSGIVCDQMLHICCIFVYFVIDYTRIMQVKHEQRSRMSQRSAEINGRGGFLDSGPFLPETARKYTMEMAAAIDLQGRVEALKRALSTTEFAQWSNELAAEYVRRVKAETFAGEVEIEVMDALTKTPVLLCAWLNVSFVDPRANEVHPGVPEITLSGFVSAR